MNYQERFEAWLRDPYFDEETRRELEAIKDNEKEKEDRFYKDLEFGTAGLRGIIGAGTNRMNIYVIRKTTQGLADYITSVGEDAKKRGVVIAYDSRYKSREFALEAALVLAGNGIRVYLFDELRPVPELSFSVRELGTVSGIVITASHNPAQYNGYKVYWEDGGQLPPERANAVLQRINAIQGFHQVKRLSLEEAREKGFLKMIGREMDDRYLSRVKTLSIHPEIMKDAGDALQLVYTPLHGTGYRLVPRVLREMGLENVHIVKEQEEPDPMFSTVSSPNPEEPEAFAMAIQLAEEKGADVIIGTDPDCDRVGVVVRDEKGQFRVLSGNQTGCLLLHYILSQKKKRGTPPAKGVVVKTIVTTELGRAIAQSFGVDILDVLTGFKFIAEKIKEFEETGEKEFIFGFEESSGYLAGDFVRDKDGVITSMLVAEMAAYYKTRGTGLCEALRKIYDEYGYYREKLLSVVLKGKEGLEKIHQAMESLREDCPAAFGGVKVLAVRDYQKGTRYDRRSEKNEALSLPKSDVLYFELENHSWICIRPSGTEPKIKIYLAVSAADSGEAKKALDNLERSMMETVGGLLN
ncbi:MAG: phospho-sugar mutase [Clostridia bacterium]